MHLAGGFFTEYFLLVTTCYIAQQSDENMSHCQMSNSKFLSFREKKYNSSIFLLSCNLFFCIIFGEIVWEIKHITRCPVRRWQLTLITQLRFYVVTINNWLTFEFSLKINWKKDDYLHWALEINNLSLRTWYKKETNFHLYTSKLDRRDTSFDWLSLQHTATFKRYIIVKQAVDFT